MGVLLTSGFDILSLLLIRGVLSHPFRSSDFHILLLILLMLQVVMSDNYD